MSFFFQNQQNVMKSLWNQLWFPISFDLKLGLCLHSSFSLLPRHCQLGWWRPDSWSAPGKDCLRYFSAVQFQSSNNWHFCNLTVNSFSQYVPPPVHYQQREQQRITHWCHIDNFIFDGDGSHYIRKISCNNTSGRLPLNGYNVVLHSK